MNVNVLGKTMNKRNYQKELESLIKNLEKEELQKPQKVFLHSCCAPCSSYCLEYLSQYFEVTVFYYNPNIYPEEEYRNAPPRNKGATPQERKKSATHLRERTALSESSGTLLSRRIHTTS